MLLTQHETRSVMDLDLTATLPVHSRKSSASLVEKVSLPALLTQAQHRRLSTSQIIPVVSQSLLLAASTGLRRSPLAPLDLQLSATLNTDIVMVDDKELQMGRKPSITLTNATRPTPYSQRNSTRRPLPSQHRRTSLPALHLPPDAAHANIIVSGPVELALPQEEDIYSRLSTFTFGDAPASLQHQAPLLTVSKSGDNSEGISPLQRLSSFDRTPRPSIVHSHSHSGTDNAPLLPSIPGQARPRSHGWSSPSEDEDDVRRNNTRSKMRAIDDGTRRPSLPSNNGLSQIEAYPVSGNTEKGKGKVSLNLDRRLQEGASQAEVATIGANALSSPSSHTDGEGDIELTDVDLIPVDYAKHRRRKGRDPIYSDHSSVHTFGGDGDGRLSSDVSSLYGDDEDDHEAMDEDEDEDNHDPLRKDSTRTWNESMGGGRRRSLPVAIPQPNNSHQPSGGQDGHYPVTHSQRYDDSIQGDYEARAIALAQYRRPSRSMDDDSQRLALHLRRRTSHASVGASAMTTSPAISGNIGVPSSEPDMRSVAFANAMAHADMVPSGSDVHASLVFADNSINASNDSPYEGLDLSYILSVSGSVVGTNGPIARSSDAWSGRLSVGSSVAAREGRERENSWAFGWGISTGGRRPSTATVNDDTFLRFVKNNDYSYDERRREWSFVKEKAEGESGGLPLERPGEEIWRCLWVGRYRVERVRSKNTDPNKPAQMRLNVKHIPDPYSKGNRRGGPLTFIHKHSRAQAFSIFRGHQLPQRHLKTSSSILLAPKKVQEQFTSTRTTSKLSTHGLLEEKSPTTISSGRGKSAETVSSSSVASGAGSSTKVSTSSHNSRGEEHLSPRRAKEKVASAVDRKGKGVDRSSDDTTSNTSQSTINASSSTVGAATSKVIDVIDERLSKNPVNRLRDAENRPTSSLAETSSMTSDGSHVFSSAVSAWDQSSINSSQRHSTRPTSDVRRTTTTSAPATRGSVASLDDQPIRTSHQEAFATLDPPFIEYLRMHSQNYDGLDHESHSRFRALKKLFNSQATKNAPKISAVGAGSPVAVLEGHYTPPWLTMAARSKQEEQERVIKNLNDSFRDVGLLPSFKPNERNKSRSSKKGKRINETVFDQIPDESLYMLIPMWPGETDHANSLYSDQEPDQDIPLEERQYLLVYYVPMLSKEKHDDKKRSRQSQTSSANSHHSDSSITKENKTNIALNSFNILARLVSYKDIYGSGIRIPTNGLSVTGPIMEAIRAIPYIRFHVDDLSLIIGFCDKRERGVEVVPEGCEKLGLCLPRTSPDPDLDAPLSSLGRAAVEMAWLGALAVMGFDNVSR